MSEWKIFQNAPGAWIIAERLAGKWIVRDWRPSGAEAIAAFARGVR